MYAMRLRTLLSLVMLALLATVAHAQYIAYVGTYTNGTSKGIYAFRFDSATGKASPLGLAAESESPSFLAVHPDGKHLYAANEINQYKGETSGAVSAFEIDHKTGILKPIGEQSSAGSGTAHISLDNTGRYALVANYGGGTVAVLPIAASGELGTATQRIQHTGSSVNQARQTAPHAHYVSASPDNRFVLAADLGIDKVMIYRFGEGKLTPNDPPFAALAPGAGPRHFAFSPNGKFLYVTNELNSTVTAFAWDGRSGKATELQTISTLPSDWKEWNSTAEILVHPNGKFLYVSNRGRNSIALFAIDSATGKLTYKGDTATGKTPRNFNFDPTGKWLWAANQFAGDIFIFSVDGASGELKRAGEALKVDKPVAVVFVKE